MDHPTAFFTIVPGGVALMSLSALDSELSILALFLAEAYGLRLGGGRHCSGFFRRLGTGAWPRSRKRARTILLRGVGAFLCRWFAGVKKNLLFVDTRTWKQISTSGPSHMLEVTTAEPCSAPWRIGFGGRIRSCARGILGACSRRRFLCGWVPT